MHLLADGVFGEADFRSVGVVCDNHAGNGMVLADPSGIGEQLQSGERAATGDDGIGVIPAFADDKRLQQVVRGD
jgi:hypothetical protein